MRDRLIELLRVPIYPKEGADPAEVVADYLLDSGVIVPPCKVGDTVYYINTLYFSPLERNRVYRAEVTRIVITQRGVSFVAKVRYMGGVIEITEDGFGEKVFLTREEAKRALKGEHHAEIH